ncbi:MAG: hypothetical protein ACXWP5_04415 [Bdellovibrionota bacterium]
MSQIDPQVLYLILTKVAAKEIFYNFDGAKTTGTITTRQLGEVYERITGNRVGTRLNWTAHLSQVDLLLKQCGLPSLSPVVVIEGGAAATPESLSKAHQTRWPPFAELKNLYRKGK